MNATPFSIDTGNRWLTVPQRPGARLYDRDLLIRDGFTAADITVHDERMVLRDVALAIRRGIEADSELKEFQLEWVHAAHGKEAMHWPEDAKIVVTAEQGGSEGWYLEIYVLEMLPDRSGWSAQRLISAKTFERQRVWVLAAKVAVWLGLI